MNSEIVSTELLTSYQKSARTKKLNTLSRWNAAVEAGFTKFPYEYDKLTVRDMAEIAHSSLATFYNHFESKDEFIVEALDFRLKKSIAELTPRVEEPFLYRKELVTELSIFTDVATELPGITQGLLPMRYSRADGYKSLLPYFQATIQNTIENGQKFENFNQDMQADELTDFAINALSAATATKHYPDRANVATLVAQTIAKY